MVLKVLPVDVVIDQFQPFNLLAIYDTRAQLYRNVAFG